jgi:hypothetical protein
MHRLLPFVPLALACVGYTSCETAGPGAVPATEIGALDAPAPPAADGCAPVAALRCGEVVSGDTGDWNAGATALLDGYPIAVGNYEAPEVSYAFRPVGTGEVTLRLLDAAPTERDHDLILLHGEACSADNAVSRGFNSLTFDAVAGEPYTVVVDGFAGDRGPFELAVECDVDAAGIDPALPDDGGLVNVSADLQELLELGALDGACERWSGDPADRRDMLLCGKSMFFYEGFGGLGVPTALFDFLGSRFPEELGVGFTEYGLVPDPYSPTDRPLGFPDGAKLAGQDTAAFGCAGCHFGQLPDGRYAVGYPNLQYEYGKLSLALFLAPLKANPFFDESAQNPEALEAIRPVLDALDDNPWLRMQLGTTMLPLIPAMGEAPQLSPEVQGQYASWDPGVLDAVLVPAPVDDGVHTPTRILDLWGIPSLAEAEAHGMASPLLGWNGDAPDLHNFLSVFVQVADGDVESWDLNRFTPLVEYLATLRAPDNPNPPSPTQRAAGEELFADHCAGCHDGPRAQSTDVFDYDEIGTDDAYRRWGDPDLTGDPCCGLPGAPGTMRHGLKAPRLTGLWSKDKLLHNGAVRGLEQLLCLQERPSTTEWGFTAGGHEFGCELATPDRESLVLYLLSL